GANMLALNGGRPELMDIKRLIAAFVDFREEVITRRTVFELGKARERAHILAGLSVAVANIDEVIALIRKAKDPQTAREELMAVDWPAEDVAPVIDLIDDPGHRVIDGRYRLSEAQARAILELRLHRLTGLERDKIADDLREVAAQIEEYLRILQSREKLMGILRDELVDMKDQFATPRRSTITESEFEQDIEDLIQREDMVITVTDSGYIKRVPLSTYRAQRRGGKGRSGMSTREEDVVRDVFVANTHAPVLFFSSKGMVYKLKAYKLPQGTPQSLGKAMVNLLPIDQDETITTVMALPEDEEAWEGLFVMFATASGGVRRNRLSDFTNVMANGKIAMKLDEGDTLVRVRTCTEEDDVLLTTRAGKCIRFPVTDVRVFAGRTSTGVRGIRLAKDDRVINMSGLLHVGLDTETREDYLRAVAASRRLAGADYTDKDDEKAKDEAVAARLETPPYDEMVEKEEFLLTVTENGYGKRSSAYEYRIAGRGGQGIANIEMSERNGPVVASFSVVNSDQIVMVTDRGKLIRIPVNGVRIAGRNTQGVTLFSVSEDERVVSVTRLRDMDDDGDDGIEEDETAVEGDAIPAGETVTESAAEDSAPEAGEAD
ncbi:MAG: DNA gyrase subunit A, partial [Rhodospirillales bacterium]|nr:DNA gyrase subunit A [Rhodospirillales bacterium]